MTVEQVKNYFANKNLQEVAYLGTEVEYERFVAKNKSKVYYIRVDTRGEQDPTIVELFDI